MPLRFFYEEVDYKLKSPRKTSNWIKESIKREGRILQSLNYVFCKDDYLSVINQDYLGHSSLTDIITFDNSFGKSLSGEIYISIERVKENALKFASSFEEELRRVMIHGVLHLCGHKDKTPLAKSEMRIKEDAYLSLHKRMFHVKH